MIILESKDPVLAVVASIRGPVVPSAGYGGWNRVPRPFKKPITEWNAGDALSLTVSFVLDADLGFNVAAAERGLELLAGLDADEEPPTFKIYSRPAGVVPHDNASDPERDWFLESLTWDRDEAINRDDGTPRRRAGEMVLTEYVDDEILADLKPVKKKAKKKAAPIRKDRYTVKKGDTLSKIAARLKVKGGWKALAKLNGIRDPKKLKVGARLKVPK